MKKLIIKTFFYFVLVFISLELITRAFHLYEEHPTFIINKQNVKTYAPNQKGYYVTGNRRMNFAEYHINDYGFNSYKSFNPSKQKFNVAIIGDSFIEGLHQNYFNSIGKKIENHFNNDVEVFQLGHSGYDLADQLNLMASYHDKFEQIDLTVIYLKYENDIQRDHYTPDQYWIDSQYFTFSRIKKKIKLFAYLESIGVLDKIRNLKTKLLIREQNKATKKKDVDSTQVMKKYLSNFKTLTNNFGFNKERTIFLLDKEKTYDGFLNYCDSLNYKYIDFGQKMKVSKLPTTLIYDMHWNNNGREIIANTIVDYIEFNNLQNNANK